MDTIKDKTLPELAMKDNKVAILFRECKPNGGPSFAIQAEYDINNKIPLSKMGSKVSKMSQMEVDRRSSNISMPS